MKQQRKTPTNLSFHFSHFMVLMKIAHPYKTTIVVQATIPDSVSCVLSPHLPQTEFRVGHSDILMVNLVTNSKMSSSNPLPLIFPPMGWLDKLPL